MKNIVIDENCYRRLEYLELFYAYVCDKHIEIINEFIDSEEA